ncbi:putative ABC transport system permease protein [Ardenticatena maritima]|uniref:Putative ABC transport system permease protein n=1 Tax=Ardenticatena maritima TaxID=872965 RepID=A0A0M9UCL9_9CHLR|nr:ABC transporter permease [Ardenticatena maritima]KPL87796.1 hypothetical protein SE16_09540 [Ardenticatena maritima]GAP63087.1 putative ABC transport system permease protein [Ardenticatena maritima]
MNIKEGIRIALRALSANKLRSVLTMLGIIIGVGAVIALLSVGQGVQQFVTESIQSTGTNLLFVIPGSPGGGSTGLTLSVKDAEAIADPRNVSNVVAVAAELSRGANVERGRITRRFPISGVTIEFPQVRNFTVEIGRFFDDSEAATGSRVAVIGANVYDVLFPEGEYPIGQVIKINGIPFRVIGVMERKGGGAFGSEDDNIWIPLSTMHRYLSSPRNQRGELLVSVIYVQVASADVMDQVADEITELLRQRHNIQFREDDDFTVINQADLVAIFGEITGVLTLFLGAIAGISLLVGGIGIMNIMLVSVTERTREIGIRKAVGAKRRDILFQFLIEAIVLSMLGGFLGIVLGWIGSIIISTLSEDLTPIVTLDAVLLATGFSAAVGLFFGIYPAYRASRLNPIEALRYE